MLRNFGIKSRIFSLLILLILSTLLASGSFWVGMDNLSDKAVEQAKTAMTEGFERTLKYSVQSVATKIGDAIAKSEGTGVPFEEIVQSELKKIRYGKNGYYFAYNTAGISVAHPIKPSMQGENRLNNQDKKGNSYIKDLIAAAKGGGGFVT